MHQKIIDYQRHTVEFSSITPTRTTPPLNQQGHPKATRPTLPHQPQPRKTRGFKISQQNQPQSDHHQQRQQPNQPYRSRSSPSNPLSWDSVRLPSENRLKQPGQLGKHYTWLSVDANSAAPVVITPCQDRLSGSRGISWIPIGQVLPTDLPANSSPPRRLFPGSPAPPRLATSGPHVGDASMPPG